MARANFLSAIANLGKKRIRTESDSTRQKEYRERNQEAIKKQRHLHYLDNRDEVLKRRREYREKNRAALNKKLKEYQTNNKIACLTYYSRSDNPACAFPGCTINDIDMLTIDHVDGNGSKHRRTIHGGNKGGHGTYLWLIKNKLPDGFQVLCFNHNFKKHILSGRAE